MQPEQARPNAGAGRPKHGPLSKTHSEVLSTLVQKDEWRAEDLAAELYLSEGAVRSHLNVLAELGLVHVRLERNGPGRPRHLYSISSEGRATFPTGYHHWLLAVLGVLKNHHPELYASLPAELVTSGAPAQNVLAEPVSDRVGQFEWHMRQLGHQMRSTRTLDGEQIEIFNCGSFHAARAHPWICETERAWIEAHFPERAVALTSCMTSGASTCTFALTPRPSP